jgi:hypothetical protein
MMASMPYVRTAVKRSPYQHKCECDNWPECWCETAEEWDLVFERMLDDWEADMKALEDPTKGDFEV